MSRRQVVYFRTIVPHIIEFPCAGITGNQFPISLTHGPIAFMLPENRFHVLPLTAFEYRQQTLSLQGLNGLPVEFLRISRFRNINQRWHDVRDVTHLSGKFSLALDDSRP